MDDKTARALYDSFRSAERAWIRSQEKNHHTSGLQTPSLEECSLHYGELAFVLAGLKPAVLIQLPSSELNCKFYHEVLLPHLVQHPSYDATKLDCRLITRNIRSPEMSLTGNILVWNQATVRHHAQSTLVQATIQHLCPVQAPQMDDLQTKEAIISENDLATLLDIPGRLPASEQEIRAMLEVTYLDILPSGTVLLSAFAAQPDELKQIAGHHKRYKERVAQLFGINLGVSCHELSPSI
ncbi:hypothetical protein BGZ94_002620 [Podila epigama]|nr:hypothetical protein BGZ94_002620 [Podila epigama]